MEDLLNLITNPLLLKQVCLFATIFCLWKAFCVFCYQWYCDKVKDGILKAIEYLTKLKSDITNCVDGNQLVDIALNIPHKFVRDITISVGDYDSNIEYQYELNLDRFLKTPSVILKCDNELVCTNFKQLQADLINEIDALINELQK